MASLRLALDMYGGDNGLPHILKAAGKTLTLLPSDVTIILCGDEEEIHAEIKKLRLESALDSGRFLISHAPEKLLGDHGASRQWRQHPNSSLVRAITLQKEGKAELSLSAGDTGALLSSALFILGRQTETERPVLAATLPTRTGGTVLLLDVGANLLCKPHHLTHFGSLGSQYMAHSCSATPRIALLNVGHENYKGTPTIQEAHTLLNSTLGYCGYCEGHQILSGDYDVVICDGFTGNALLKMSESLFSFIKNRLAESLTHVATDNLTLFNSELYGAVPLLGLQGAVFKAHGSSSTNALTHAILTAVKAVYLRVQ